LQLQSGKEIIAIVTTVTFLFVQCHLLYGSDTWQELKDVLEEDDLTFVLDSEHRPNCLIQLMTQSLRHVQLQDSERSLLVSNILHQNTNFVNAPLCTLHHYFWCWCTFFLNFYSTCAQIKNLKFCEQLTWFSDGDASLLTTVDKSGNMKRQGSWLNCCATFTFHYQISRLYRSLSLWWKTTLASSEAIDILLNFPDLVWCTCGCRMWTSLSSMIALVSVSAWSELQFHFPIHALHPAFWCCGTWPYLLCCGMIVNWWSSQPPLSVQLLYFVLRR
jgi:hypothetical protein